jgi:hypothetical protein
LGHLVVITLRIRNNPLSCRNDLAGSGTPGMDGALDKIENQSSLIWSSTMNISFENAVRVDSSNSHERIDGEGGRQSQLPPSDRFKVSTNDCITLIILRKHDI